MGKTKALLKDTVIYGVSSIVGRFLNYLLVPIYTESMPPASGGYGVITEVYAYTAIVLVMLTFGMETTFFRFVNKDDEDAGKVFATTFTLVSMAAGAFIIVAMACLNPISTFLGHPDHPEWVASMILVTAMDAVQAILFARLRYEHRAIRFMTLKMAFIISNVVLNSIYFILLPKLLPEYAAYFGHVGYAFIFNLVCTGGIMLYFVPDILRTKWSFDKALARRMLAYTWPLFVLGVAGILNQVCDKIIFKHIYAPGNLTLAEQELGIYGACVKIAMLMALFTQAYRFAIEPMIFGEKRQQDVTQTNVIGMKFFIISTLFGFLCVMGWLDVLRNLFIRDADYWPGLKVVPIVMVAEILMGIYFNLSFWYKLIDKTIYGAWFSLAGCAVLLGVNWFFIPEYSYMACAWAGVAGYGTCVVLSYVIGQRVNPTHYPLADMAVYVAAAAVIFGIMQLVPETWPLWQRTAVNTLLIMAYVAIFVRRDVPKEAVETIMKRFRR